jgi:hypothetical protein
LDIEAILKDFTDKEKTFIEKIRAEKLKKEIQE